MLMNLEGRIEALYVGSAPGPEKIPQPALEVTLEGIVGDKHAGLSRRANVDYPEYTPGTPVRNSRQWSAVSPEELALVAAALGIPYIDPAWLGANLSISGIPKLTTLPKGSKLLFPEGAGLVVNAPCTSPGEVIASKYPEKELKANLFPKAAYHKRGLVGMVECAGIIRAGDVIRVQVYEPKMYVLPERLQS
jgi:MOSC domain-containing protein YiiM